MIFLLLVQKIDGRIIALSMWVEKTPQLFVFSPHLRPPWGKESRMAMGHPAGAVSTPVLALCLVSLLPPANFFCGFYPVTPGAKCSRRNCGLPGKGASVHPWGGALALVLPRHLLLSFRPTLRGIHERHTLRLLSGMGRVGCPWSFQSQFY